MEATPFQKRLFGIERFGWVLMVGTVLVVVAFFFLFANRFFQSGERPENLTPSQEIPMKAPPVVWKSAQSQENKDILISFPQENDSVLSPLLVSGLARGQWFFEATFPLEVVDAHGISLGAGYVQSFSNWMTEEFIPFQGEVEFSESTTKKGTLIISNANPSGLSKHHREVRVPIQFTRVREPDSRKPCVVTGCSRHLCADADMMTTCEFLPEYACYQKATCERQKDDTCGWTENETLGSCVQKARKQF